jgi:hypothetical protein
MTKKFYEILLSELVNRRDIAEVALSEVYHKQELSVKERIESSIDLLGDIADINNRIHTLSGLVTEKNVDNNNN